MLNHHSSTHPQFSFSSIFVFFTFTNFFYNIFTSIIFFLMEKLIRNICFNFYLFLNKKLFSCSFTYKPYLLDLDLENPNSKKKKKNHLFSNKSCMHCTLERNTYSCDKRLSLGRSSMASYTTTWSRTIFSKCDPFFIGVNTM